MKFVEGQFVVPVKVEALEGEDPEDLQEYFGYLGKSGFIVNIKPNATYEYSILFDDGSAQDFSEQELIELNPTTLILYGSDNEQNKNY